METDRKGNITFEKSLETSLEIDAVRIDLIIFDIMIKDEENKLHETNNIDVPWDLSFEYNQKVKYESIELSIPLPELLLIYKIKAYRDRTYDKFKFMDHMQNKRVWITRKDFKINKDKRDIISLLESVKLNSDIIEEILTKIKFKILFDETLDAILKSK